VQPNKLLKKIGTGQLGKDVKPRDDQTSQLDSLRNSLGTNSTMPRGHVLQGRYEIEQVVGYGGMSTVYRARDMRFTQTVRVCAIKEMFDMSTDPAARRDKMQRFEMEANILAKLNHASIPKIYDFFGDNDRFFLVLEYVDGKNLESLLEVANAPLDERDVLEWAIKLCEVLSYLHNQKPGPIIFRDMKPSNVMLNNDGRLMLIDFGIAKVFLDDKKGTMIGTEGYSPPEQYKGIGQPAGDIYALGATMHHLLTNSDPRLEIPFTFHERMPKTLNPKISPEMEAIIMKALEFSIEDRWKNVEEMKAALVRFQYKLSGLVEATSHGTHALNLDISKVAEAKPNAKPTPGTNPTIRPHTGADGTKMVPVARPGQASAKDGILSVPEYLPQAKLLWDFKVEEEIRSTPLVYGNSIFIGSYDTNIYALDAKNGSFLWKTPTSAGISSSPCIAEIPGGTQLLIVGSEDHKLYALEIQKGQQMWDFQAQGPIRSSPRLYQSYVFFGSDDNHVYGVDIRGGKALWKQRTLGRVRSSPTIANGSIYIGSEDRKLYSLEISRGNINWKFDTLNSIVSTPAVADGYVYIGSDDSNFYCIDSQNGFLVWKAKTGKPIRSSPIFHNGKVYFGSGDGLLYCYDAKRGAKVWSFNTESQIISSPRIANGLVFFGAADGNIYALDADKGHAKWFYPTGNAIVCSPAIANDTLYIGSLDNRLYAIAI
jgi:outer membrane protein assembly factor BamB/tRNA A-37 threonylcarbamoyl transferase component Bud32